MMTHVDDPVSTQLSLTAIETVTLAEGGSTVLTPARWVPEVSSVAPVRLEGAWEVAYWPFARPEAELAGGVSDAPWATVQQPGKVFYYDSEQSPDGIPGWNRVTMEHLDAEDGAIIRRQVTVPAEWAGKRVLLRFEGIYPAGRIYWDGQPVAEQWSGLTPIEVDVTAQAAPGVHTVAVRCYRRHPSVQLDMPRHALEFVGLCRTAFLHAVEPVHISDTFLQPTLLDDNATGVLLGDVTLRNAGAPLTGDDIVNLTVQIAAADGTVAGLMTYLVTLEEAEKTITLEVPAGAVQLWNAEQPNLYTLTLRVTLKGQAEQVFTQRIGFRRFVVANGRATLNGQPVKFRGVNHLTYHPQGGMYTPEEWLRQNLIMMKRCNVNAIRTHFFGPRELVDLCDELGLYLLQELPIDWGHTYLHDPLHLGPVLHRLQAGVRRDRGHACVMVWSVGNENLPRNEVEYPAFMRHMRWFEQMVKAMDPTRPTMFPPPGPANAIRGIFEARIGEIADIHYSFKLIDQMRETGEVKSPRVWGMVPDKKEWETTFETQTMQELMASGWSGVWFSSEYGINNLLTDLLHAPYTSIISDVMEDALSGKNSQQVFIDRLNREWGNMRDDPSCLGGAYFAWIAAGAGDPWGWTRWGEDADWGILTGDLQPKSVYWAMRAIFSPVQFPPRVAWHKGEETLRIPVTSTFNGLDLADCTLRVQMAGGPPWMGLMREWRDVPMQGAPGASTTLEVPLWNEGSRHTLNGGNPIVCRCTVLDPSGYRVITADVLIMPEEAKTRDEGPMLIGPDAE
jgi:hypothetical protein